MKNYNSVKDKVEQLKDVTTRPMFGYKCYSISKKFFVGFSNKNDYQIIVRLPKERQEDADSAINLLAKAVSLDRTYKNYAKKDDDFNSIKETDEFQKIIN